MLRVYTSPFLFFLLPSELRYFPRRKCERKNAPTSKRFRCFPRNGEPRWPIHRMHEMAGNISGDFNEPPFAESTTVRRSNRANTDRVCIPRSRFSECVSGFIYSWKKSGFDSRESAGKASYYLAVTRRKRAFLGPMVDPAGRCGGSRTLILIVASRLVARSSTGYRYTRVNAVQKVTQEVVVGGNGRLGARARDAFRAVSSQNEKFAFSLR